MNKVLTVTVEGDDADDPASVFAIISDQIFGGFTSGFDQREGSSYNWNLAEDYK